jgi:hypothetical protein
MISGNVALGKTAHSGHLDRSGERARAIPARAVDGLSSRIDDVNFGSCFIPLSDHSSSLSTLIIDLGGVYLMYMVKVTFTSSK